MKLDDFFHLEREKIITAEKLADMVGVSQNTIHRLRHGLTRRPSYDLATRIEQATGGLVRAIDVMPNTEQHHAPAQ